MHVEHVRAMGLLGLYLRVWPSMFPLAATISTSWPLRAAHQQSPRQLRHADANARIAKESAATMPAPAGLSRASSTLRSGGGTPSFV